MHLTATTVPLNQLRAQVPPAYRQKTTVVSAYPHFAAHRSAQFLPRHKRGRKAEGLRFEAKVVRDLAGTYRNFLSSLPFSYSLLSGARYCIPDGFLVTDTEVIITEVKLSHTISSWFQLKNLYFPVVEKAFGLPVRGVEIVKWFDPEVRFPEDSFLFSSVEEFCKTSLPLGVCLWR